MKNKIKGLRKPLKISQDELAKICGVTRQTINAIENDKYDPTLALAFKLAMVLKVTVDELFEYEEGENSWEQINWYVLKLLGTSLRLYC